MQVSFNITTVLTLCLNFSYCNINIFLKHKTTHFCVFRTIYEKLASAFTEEMAALYRQRVDEISPNIRYCAYNIGE